MNWAPKSGNDFRSDLFSSPLPEMLEAIQQCNFDDLVSEEDEVVLELERKVARLAGKEAAAFMCSGTLSNQVGIRVNLFQPPHSVICDSRAHLYLFEGSGMATLSQAMPTPVKPANGMYLTLEDIQENYIAPDIYRSPTKLIALENTIQGTVVPIEEIELISQWAKEKGIRLHLDGARLWNACAATGIPLHEWCQYFDTISVCLSKGLCAPVGSLLIGDKATIDQAKWFRKQQGGGIRKATWLAAAGIVAIDRVFPTLSITHAKTKELAERLVDEGVVLELPVHTNFIAFDAHRSGIDVQKFCENAKKYNLRVSGSKVVLHYWNSDEAIENLFRAFMETKCMSCGGTPRSDLREWFYD